MPGKIGPHEGQELALMLEGRKRIAYFPEIDPTDEFAPHVAEGRVARYVWLEKRELLKRAGYPPQVLSKIPDAVVYYMPGAEQELDEFLTAVETSFLAETHDEHAAADAKIGLLLGYSEEDVATFLARA